MPRWVDDRKATLENVAINFGAVNSFAQKIFRLVRICYSAAFAVSSTGISARCFIEIYLFCPPAADRHVSEPGTDEHQG